MEAAPVLGGTVVEALGVLDVLDGAVDSVGALDDGVDVLGVVDDAELDGDVVDVDVWAG